MAINIRKKDDDPTEGEGGGGDEPTGDEMEAVEADPFIRTSVDTVSWFQENRNTVFVGLGLAAVVGLVAYIAYSQYEASRIEASTSWGEALAVYEQPVEGTDYVDSIEQTDFNLPDGVVQPDLKTKWSAINKKAKATLDKYGDSSIASQARLTRAAAAYQLENYGEAADHYDTYLEDKPSEQLKPVVYYGAGLAHGASGNVERAMELFDKLADAEDDHEVLALYNQGMIQEAAGNLEKAKELYTEAIDSSSSSPYHTNIKRRRTLISVRE